MMGKTVYLTKYAVSGGVTAHEELGRSTWRDGGVWIRMNGVYNSQKLGRDVFETWPEALAAAEKARAKKLASLKKQIAKIEAAVFVDPSA